MRRTLTLRREALAALTTDDLAVVAGGAATVNGLTCPVGRCLPVPQSAQLYQTCQPCGTQVGGA